MVLEDFHTHTNFSDGKCAPSEMVLSAISKGFLRYGISDHSYTGFDSTWCMPAEKREEYKKELRWLQKKFKDQIELYVGIEQDLFAGEPEPGYDYAIAALHYIKVGDEYITIDESAETLKKAAQKHFAGDMLLLCEEYYNTLSRFAESKGKYAFIAHLDLVTKFNENGELFSEEDPRYQAAARACIDKLLPLGIPFEINTGAISRGYRKSPYPRLFLAKYIAQNGGKFILSSDAHSPENIGYNFAEAEDLFAKAGLGGAITKLEF